MNISGYYIEEGIVKNQIYAREEYGTKNNNVYYRCVLFATIGCSKHERNQPLRIHC